MHRYRLTNAKGATFETLAPSYDAARARGAQIGFADPVSCRLIDPDPEASHRAAINAAIAQSNRAGRRIGGAEARAIHAILRTR